MPVEPAGWENVDPDPTVYRKASMGRRDATLKWGGGCLIAADGAHVEDSTLHEVSVDGVIERLDSADLIPFWRDLYRVCAHGASVIVSGIYWSAVEVQADPTRKRGLSERMFAYLSAGGRTQLATDPSEDDFAAAQFDGIEMGTDKIVRVTEPEWDARSDEAKAWSLDHNLNVVRRLIISLSVTKPPPDSSP